MQQCMDKTRDDSDADGPSPAASTALTSLPQIHLRGVALHAITEQQCIEHILESLDEGRGGWCVTPNLAILRRLSCDRSFAKLCEGASLRLADGMPLIWASRLQGTPLPERVAGSNLIWSLSGAVAARGRSVFLLGGAEQTAEESARRLQERYPDLHVTGTACPPFGFEKDRQYLDELRPMLRRLAPDIVYVGLGSPKQEHLICQLRQELPGAWWLGVGVSFSFVCGHVQRAPRWMQRTGLEWVHRLFQEPQRLARRYLIEGLPFAALLLAGAAARGVGRRLSAVCRRQPSA